MIKNLMIKMKIMMMIKKMSMKMIIINMLKRMKMIKLMILIQNKMRILMMKQDKIIDDECGIYDDNKDNDNIDD